MFLSSHRIVLLSVLAGMLPLFDPAPSNARIVICESFNNQPSYCRGDTRNGVRLVQRFSKSDCREGETWGYDRRGIWVSQGCRAKFETNVYSANPYWGGSADDYHSDRRNSYRRNSPRGTLTCESWGERQTFCQIPLGNAQVEVQRQLSDTFCQLGRNWGWNGGGIWVTGGCRAVFAIY